MTSRRSVVILGFGREEHLEAALEAAAAELRDGDEVVLVDNGIADFARRRTSWPATVRVVGDGANTGFAGGCNLGAAMASGDVLVFVNSDAIVQPGAFAALGAALDEPEVGIACGMLRLAAEPHLVNSVGNPLHFSGITWAGAYGEPVSSHTAGGIVPVATGGLFAISRQVWDVLGGFDPTYFAYHEDNDLSIRTWLGGLRVVFVPNAVADHFYEFGRSPHKMYLLERNRLITVLTDYPPRLLGVVVPALFVVEPLLLVQAVLQGWGVQKLRSWLWLLGNVGLLRQRRRRVQAAVRVPTALDDLLCARIEPSNVARPPGMGMVNTALAVYWALASRVVRGRR